MTEHDRFESAYRECFPVASSMQADLFERDDDGYIEAKVHTAFTLWKAARATPSDHIGDAAEKVDADSVPVATLPLVLTEQMRTAVKNWVQRYPVLGAGIYAQELWNDILAAAPQSPQKVSDTVRDAERVYPDDLTSELREVLGWPNFKCGPIAHLMVASGAQIKPKSEDEQAAVLHWLVKLVLAHGEDWKEAASAEIRSMQESLKSAPPLKPVSEETKP